MKLPKAKTLIKHGLVWAPFLVVLLAMVKILAFPTQVDLPAKIWTGQTVSKGTQTFVMNQNTPGAEFEEEMWVYKFSGGGYEGQTIHGSRAWNNHLFHDFDGDGKKDFIVRQEGRLPPYPQVQHLSLYSWAEGQWNFVRSLPREQFGSLKLEFHFFPIPYWLLLTNLAGICFLIGLGVETVFLALWLVKKRRQKSVVPR